MRQNFLDCDGIKRRDISDIRPADPGVGRDFVAGSAGVVDESKILDGRPGRVVFK